jgi:hypothetical protein
MFAMDMGNRFSRMLLVAGLAALITPGWCGDDSRIVMDSAEPDATADPGWVREKAYSAAGVGFFRCLSGVAYPWSGKFAGPRPFAFPINWARQERENVDRYPYTDWKTLDYGGGPAAIYTVFNMKYLGGADDWFNQYFTKIPTLRYLKKAEIKKIQENEAEIRSRSIVFLMGFNPALTRFVYYPGDLLFHGGETMKEPWLAETPEGIRSGARTDHKIFQDTRGLVAIINGTFIHHDNYSLYKKGGFRFGGFGYDFKAVQEPEPDMATAAIYEDGMLRMGAYKNLPNKARIRMFVQNKFMILEEGSYSRDASPPHYTRYDDMIARSYLWRHENGWMGYMWTMNLPPQIAAKLAHDMGMREMMILDIHSPISCQVSRPESRLEFPTWRDFKRGSFNFVPVFGDESAVGRSLVAVSRALEKQVQIDYRRESFVLGEKDHFAVFLRGSPEAERMARPRDGALKLASRRD